MTFFGDESDRLTADISQCEVTTKRAEQRCYNNTRALTGWPSVERSGRAYVDMPPSKEGPPLAKCAKGMTECEHERTRSRCTQCGGGSICRHGRTRSECKECGGASICLHGRQRYRCKECGGVGICQHGRDRRNCKECVSSYIGLSMQKQLSGQDSCSGKVIAFSTRTSKYTDHYLDGTTQCFTKKELTPMLTKEPTVDMVEQVRATPESVLPDAGALKTGAEEAQLPDPGAFTPAATAEEEALLGAKVFAASATEAALLDAEASTAVGMMPADSVAVKLEQPWVPLPWPKVHSIDFRDFDTQELCDLVMQSVVWPRMHTR